MTGRIIDAHLHLWDRSRSRYGWITPELGPLHRDFGPREAEAELRAAGVAAVMYGGDWPMSVPHGGYQHTWAVMRACLDRLTPDQRDAVLGGTAERVYGLGRAGPDDPARNETSPERDR